MKKITLEDINAWMDAQLAETQYFEERKEIVDKAKLQAYYLGALDKYARVTKEPSGEFWERQKEEGYEYKVGRLPEWGNPCADDLSSLENAYNWGEDEADAAAEIYEGKILPLLAAKASRECVLMDDGKKAYTCTKRIAEELLRRHRSGKHGWGANWWED